LKPVDQGILQLFPDICAGGFELVWSAHPGGRHGGPALRLPGAGPEWANGAGPQGRPGKPRLL